MGLPPIVTGVSPNEGPPGTRIKIRGENFGSSPTDLIGLTICGCDCLMSAEWKSPNKIVVISGPVKGKGDVIVTTRYGGEGTSNVTFKGYYETIGPLKESAVWVEEAQLFVSGIHSLAPNAFQQVDPLGLSVEENEKHFPEEELHACFPNQSGDITSKNFSSGYFLLENHHLTSFNDLQAGLMHLRRKVDSQKEGQLSFLKANIGSVMDQLDTLVHLSHSYEQDVPNTGTEPAFRLTRIIMELEREAGKLFDDVLARRDRAEMTRNALGVLTRFRFLFCLPCAIKRNVNRGEYDLVVNDYIRVRNLFEKTEVPLFQLALKEIENCISVEKQHLLEDLQTMPCNVDRQKRIVRYLIQLEVEGDPAWLAINSQIDYIRRRFKEIYDHAVMENECIEHKLQGTLSRAECCATMRANYVDDLCSMLCDNVPNVLTLSNTYFSGGFRVKVDPDKQTEYKSLIKGLMDEFSECIRTTVLCRKPSPERGYSHILDNGNGSSMVVCLPDVLEYTQSAYTNLSRLDVPTEALSVLSKLMFELRVYTMSALFKHTAQQASNLTESWSVRFGGKHSGITDMPLKFEQLVIDAIQLVKESVCCHYHEGKLILDHEIASVEYNKQIRQVLLEFHTILVRLANVDGDDDDEYANSHTESYLNNSDDNGKRVKDESCATETHLTSATKEDAEINRSASQSDLVQLSRSHFHVQHTNNNALHYNEYHQPYSLPVRERRELITLSNSIFARTKIFPYLMEKIIESRLPVPQAAFDTASENLNQLEKLLLDKYLELKCDPLVGTIEPSMYLGQFEWHLETMPTGLIQIRPYVKDCLNNVLRLHSEISGISVSLLPIVLPPVIHTIAEEIYRLMSCVRSFSRAGAQQATLDIQALHEFLRLYCNEKASAYFQEALKFLPDLTNDEKRHLNSTLRQCKTRMKIQLWCLAQSNS